MPKILLFTLVAFLLNPAAANAALNTLTAAQKEKGWRLLFNGKNLDGWRAYQKDGKVAGAWKVEDGILKKVTEVRSSGLMTVDSFTDFDLNWEWRVQKGGNNGVKYFIQPEKRKQVIGHEYQMLDDAAFAKKGGAKGLTASFYNVLPPAADKPVKPAGEWNHSRIFVLGDTVEHWLNGKMVLQYKLGSKELLDAVQNSKFKKHAGFGNKKTGHILLTDHKDQCEFKNIRIREFK